MEVAPLWPDFAPPLTLTLVDSYHCSRYNVNTGVLTEEMFLSALARVRDEIIR